MNVSYDNKADLVYIRLDDREQEVLNRRLSDSIVLDIGEDEQIVGIEILDASRHLALEKLLPVNFQIPKNAA